MNEQTMTARFDMLTESGKQAVMEYMDYLLYRERRESARKMRETFEEMNALLDGDTGGWNSEEEIAEEITAMRRARGSYEHSA